ncbi:MAG: 4Fe-4S dicluster domain-containing protein [Dehalococcoidia bacterium]|nr:4Fe-4S dicluster domain-containing protein [Dehalococcoidia bacterium]
MAKAILYDTTKCTACRACQVACKGWNELPAEVTTNRGTYENPADLSPTTWLKMKFREIEPGGKVRWLFTRRSCMHCTDAGCVKVCPSKALYHHELGFVAYNKDLCTGCGYCIEACPFDVPRSDRNLLTGIAKMDKCTLCTTPGLDRIAEGWEPACVKTCPTNALQYDDRDKLVAEGRKRVDSLRDAGWANANLYGENELGGLHVMYVLDDHPSVYELPVNPQISAATVAWQDAIQPLGWAVGGLTVLGLGLNYMVARANINREKEKKDVAGS